MFVTEGPLDPDSPLFVGRQAELKQMESWLAHVHCVGGVLGARQTGKTSLLLKLRSCFQDKYHFVFVNVEGIAGADAGEAYGHIAQELLDQLAGAVPETRLSQPGNSSEFLSFLSALAQEGEAVRIAILLEEIGALPEDTAFRIAHSIRAIFNDRHDKWEYRRYVFVLSGARDMLELARGKTSPIRNVMRTLYMGDLTEEETHVLLANGMAQAGIDVSPAFCCQVYSWTSGHPYLTQLVGALLLESGELPTEKTLKSVIEQLLQDEDKNLPHLHRALDQGRRELWITIEAIAGGQRVPFSRNDLTVAELELIGAIRNEGGQCQIRNAIYREAIRQWLAKFSRKESGTATSIRLKHLADNIGQDLSLLKDYEDALRYEGDPRTRAKYRREIKQLRGSAARYQREYAELRSKLTGKQLTALRDVGAQLQLMDTKLDELLTGQTQLSDDLNALSEALLARYDTSERTIIAAITDRLDRSQIATVQDVLDALEASYVPRKEMQQILDTVQEMLVTLLRHGIVLPSHKQVAEAITAPTLEVKHKLKVTLPIIPLLLAYEGEMDLSSKANLEKVWKRLVVRLRGR